MHVNFWLLWIFRREPYKFKVTGTNPLDIAAHLSLLGESMKKLGAKLQNQNLPVSVWNKDSDYIFLIRNIIFIYQLVGPVCERKSFIPPRLPFVLSRSHSMPNSDGTRIKLHSRRQNDKHFRQCGIYHAWSRGLQQFLTYLKALCL